MVSWGKIEISGGKRDEKRSEEQDIFKQGVSLREGRGRGKMRELWGVVKGVLRIEKKGEE